MTAIYRFLPIKTETRVEVILDHIRKAKQYRLPLASNIVLEFCANLSDNLLNDNRSKSIPELVALGFWLRPASVRSMTDIQFLGNQKSKHMAAGAVFQLPPGNVPVFFLYSAIISLLCGNITVVRLSAADTFARSILLEMIATNLMAAPPILRDYLILLTYEHDDGLTTALSLACDVRLVWGGDETIAHIRSLPLKALAHELSFGDRFSASAVNAEMYLEADDLVKEKLIRVLHNDIFLFDQLACASSRLLVWIGKVEVIDQVAPDLYKRLSKEAATRALPPGDGTNLAKLNMSYLALHDLPAASYQVHNPLLTTIALENLSGLSMFKKVNYGFGLLLTVNLGALKDLAKYSDRADQTLGVWGFTLSECEEFVVASGGRGFNRVVSIGEALEFSPIWDGYNLFAGMTRLVQVL